MGKLKLNLSMSLDGYVAGPSQSLTNPLGVGGHQLHEWAFALRSFRRMQGMEGGATGPDDAIVEEWFENLGATIMGRHMFGGGDGAWEGDSWKGWWGDDPPYHHPVFVLTHHARKPLEMQGGTTFHFVTDGIQAALERARKAAGSKDISLAGGAGIAQQYVRDGLVDEMEIHLVPVLLGDGARLFDRMESGQIAFERVRAVSSPSVSHYKYRLKR